MEKEKKIGQEERRGKKSENDGRGGVQKHRGMKELCTFLLHSLDDLCTVGGSEGVLQALLDRRDGPGGGVELLGTRRRLL